MADLAISAILSLLMSSSVDFSIPCMFCSFPAKKKWHNLVRTYSKHYSFLEASFPFSKGSGMIREEENLVSAVLVVKPVTVKHP